MFVFIRHVHCTKVSIKNCMKNVRTCENSVQVHEYLVLKRIMNEKWMIMNQSHGKAS